MRIKILFTLITMAGLAIAADAYGAPLNSSVISAYRLYKDAGTLSISVPTVVEIPLADDFIERFDFALLDTTTNSFEPYFFRQETRTNEIPVSVRTEPSTRNANWMNDNTTRTYADFPLPDTTQGVVQITLSSPSPVLSSALTVLLPDNVALPNSIEIRAMVNGQNTIVVATERMTQQTVRFPQTTSDTWILTFAFGQPLRISELRLHQDNAATITARAIRFLAQPDHAYRIYFDPDRMATAPVGESGNLASAPDVLILPPSSSQQNPAYAIADSDTDGIPDIRDNCVSIENTDQEDVNNNGRGDRCDDFDQDGRMNTNDNCPDHPNRNQNDTDSDGAGDACDTEESRITERHAWIPWVGIGFAALVLVVLLVLTARSTRKT
ncbi:MAG: thrombospondin type 3 repeat-containing protein [Patescibacteria group bacterium]